MFSIVMTMDALGDLAGLGSDIKDSVLGLFFEGDIGGFISGVGYGLSNSLSKVRTRIQTWLDSPFVSSLVFYRSSRLQPMASAR